MPGRYATPGCSPRPGGRALLVQQQQGVGSERGVVDDRAVAPSFRTGPAAPTRASCPAPPVPAPPPPAPGRWPETGSTPWSVVPCPQSGNRAGSAPGAEAGLLASSSRASFTASPPRHAKAALRKRPGTPLDRVAVLLDEVEPAVFGGDDQGEVGVLYDRVGALDPSRRSIRPVGAGSRGPGRRRSGTEGPDLGSSRSVGTGPILLAPPGLAAAAPGPGWRRLGRRVLRLAEAPAEAIAGWRPPRVPGRGQRDRAGSGNARRTRTGRRPQRGQGSPVASRPARGRALTGRRPARNRRFRRSRRAAGRAPASSRRAAGSRAGRWPATGPRPARRHRPSLGKHLGGAEAARVTPRPGRAGNGPGTASARSACHRGRCSGSARTASPHPGRCGHGHPQRLLFPGSLA